MSKLLNGKLLLVCIVILNIVSLAALYSSLHQGGELRHREIFYRQIRWIVIFWIILTIFSFINYRFYYDLNILIYILSICLLIAVKLFGKEILGARRWLYMLGFYFQPSEFTKVAIIILLARFFSYPSEERRRILFRRVLLPFFLVGLASLLIFKQPDLGTALILILLFFTMGFLSQLRKRYFIGIMLFLLILTPFSWHFLKDYQKRRLLVFLNPNIDPLGAGYTIIQSKIAIGSGRIWGKGFLAGTQNQFNFLPERHTDFIFTVVAEEFGFVGCLILIGVYYLILRIILKKIEDSKDDFAKMMCLGIYTLIFLHIFINMGMTLGFLPVVGLPLLLLSYGGTHLFITAILLGIFLNINKQW